jgi:hypothetical protein
MDLLQFARGPALTWAFAIFAFGMTWRLVGILLLKRRADYSEPRHASNWIGAVKLIITRSWPHREFIQRTAFGQTRVISFISGWRSWCSVSRPTYYFSRG